MHPTVYGSQYQEAKKYSTVRTRYGTVHEAPVELVPSPALPPVLMWEPRSLRVRAHRLFG